jgi:hypothetical protein
MAALKSAPRTALKSAAATTPASPVRTISNASSAAPKASTAAAASAAPAAGASAAAAGPAIISASALPSVVHSGDTVTWEVHTTRDVVAVEAHVQLASFSLQREQPGRFGLAFHVPAGVPPIFHGSYAVELTARTSSGASASRTLQMRFE